MRPFNNIKLIFLLANTTSKLQVLDSGIIDNFKAHFRAQQYDCALRLYISRKLDNLNAYKMDQAQAMFFLANAWLKVKPETIKNCWQHTKILAFKERTICDFEPVEYPTSALPLEEEIVVELNGMLPNFPGNFDNKVTDVSQLNLEADESEMIVCYTTSTTNNEETAEGNVDETEENDNTEQDEQRVDIVECKKRLREAYETILMYEVPLDDLDRKLHRRIRMRLADSCSELNKSKEQTEKRRKNARHKIHEICAEYVETVAEHEATLLQVGDEILTAPSQSNQQENHYEGCVSSTATSETSLVDEQALKLLADEQAQKPIYYDQVQEPLADLSTDVPIPFGNFKAKVKDILQADQTLQIETHIQELLSLNNILLLQPLQQSRLMRSIFTDSLLSKMHDDFLMKVGSHNLKFTSAEYMAIVENVMNLDSGIISTLSTTTKLLQLASSMPYEKQRVVTGLAILIQKLPRSSINDAATISETELWSTYFDPILSCVVVVAEQLVLLRWLDKTINSSIPWRPDAVISIIDRLQFGETLGHGEVKIAEPTCNKAALCMDLAKIACFSKEAIDCNLLESTIAFQIHGFAVTFYLTRLEYDGLYMMYEIGHLDFPSSLAQLPVFINLKNLNILFLVCHVFWNFCKKSHVPDVIQQRRRSSVRLTDLIDLTDPTKDRNRNCSIRF
ncbi:hypothetical protein G6F53_002255 [Rhizopus delemar]|nr:hypothetical protein G6F53_002255 [Rhizopus delemar]